MNKFHNSKNKNRVIINNLMKNTEKDNIAIQLKYKTLNKSKI